MRPVHGLHDRLVTDALDAALRSLDPSQVAILEKLAPAEAHDRIAFHLARAIETAIRSIKEESRVEQGIALARSVLDLLAAQTIGAPDGDTPAPPGRMLKAILDRNPDGTPSALGAPLIPLLDSTLLTNAPGEPRLGRQIAAEIESADRIDLIMAFVRWTGVRDLLEPLARHCDNGRTLRVLTTVYTGSTETRALEALEALGAEVRVSYDTDSTRLHAKAWLFERRSGFSTAYIGSSNLTYSAQSTGLEWNIRVAEARNPAILGKFQAVFESYWANPDFLRFDPIRFTAATASARSSGATIALSPLEVRPEPFQERLLEQIALARAGGAHANLLVAATGTGKTVMAAIDYARLRATLPRARLLFVAHREEILEQSRATFRHALRDPSFGEFWVGGYRPVVFEHVFASIQSLAANGLAQMASDHFDIVIIDEFHHAAARSYAALLGHVRPRELLGLTATPERSDGLSVLDWFGGRIAAELRVWDAIDQHRLVPFAYFGIHDGMDLSAVPWRRGTGYDAEGLTNLFTANDAWANLVLKQVARRCGDPGRMRALGFCVSVAHARYMARMFVRAGVPSRAVWADTPETERKDALRALAEGRINAVFAVDLFNEGIDVPGVDTLLMLRPTDSPTLFLQQLGRGLRRSPGKGVCTVLDFVGLHRREFRLDRKFAALLNCSRAALETQVRGGFPFLPAGCHMELDRVASDIVLQSIRNGIPNRWDRKVEELRQLARERHDIGFGEFLAETGLEPGDVFEGKGRSWNALREAAGIASAPPDPQGHLRDLRHAMGRLIHIDDPLRLDMLREHLGHATPPELHACGPRERRLLRMLLASLLGPSAAQSEAMRFDAAATHLWTYRDALDDLRALFDALARRIGHLPLALAEPADVPLSLHARYTRVEIQAAYGDGSEESLRLPAWREGVKDMKDARTDVFLVTLDKTQGSFSPTTRYNDYAISRELIHWESQSTTTEDSPTGRRYRAHATLGRHVHLFARLGSEERAFFFLGPASYVSHQGERPMKITWRLRHRLPGDLFASFAAAVA
jgi:superfamily II DNA or RNA helicase/HKD family nuclease